MLDDGALPESDSGSSGSNTSQEGIPVLGYDSSLHEYEIHAGRMVSALLLALEDRMFRDSGIDSVVPDVEPRSPALSPSRSPQLHPYSLERRHNFETHNRPQVAGKKPHPSEWTARFPFLRARGFSCGIIPDPGPVCEDQSWCVVPLVCPSSQSAPPPSPHDLDVVDTLRDAIGTVLPWSGLAPSGCGGLLVKPSTRTRPHITCSEDIFASHGDVEDDVYACAQDSGEGRAAASLSSLVDLYTDPCDDGAGPSAPVPPDPFVTVEIVTQCQHMLRDAAWVCVVQALRPAVCVLVEEALNALFVTPEAEEEEILPITLQPLATFQEDENEPDDEEEDGTDVTGSLSRSSDDSMAIISPSGGVHVPFEGAHLPASVAQVSPITTCRAMGRSPPPGTEHGLPDASTAPGALRTSPIAFVTKTVLRFQSPAILPPPADAESGEEAKRRKGRVKQGRLKLLVSEPDAKPSPRRLAVAPSGTNEHAQRVNIPARKPRRLTHTQPLRSLSHSSSHSLAAPVALLVTSNTQRAHTPAVAKLGALPRPRSKQGAWQRERKEEEEGWGREELEESRRHHAQGRASQLLLVPSLMGFAVEGSLTESSRAHTALPRLRTLAGLAPKPSMSPRLSLPPLPSSNSSSNPLSSSYPLTSAPASATVMRTQSDGSPHRTTLSGHLR